MQTSPSLEYQLLVTYANSGPQTSEFTISSTTVDPTTGAPTIVVDDATGGGCDGLTASGRNTNQGAESTIAMISVLQHGRRLAAAAR